MYLVACLVLFTRLAIIRSWWKLCLPIVVFPLLPPIDEVFWPPRLSVTSSGFFTRVGLD
jgi:hypothetical protein